MLCSIISVGVKMKIIVVSAVNLRKGGTLTILRDCLSALSEMARNDDYRIVALVHDKNLALYDKIEYTEIPWSVRSWAHRLWCEYVTMNKLSKQLGDVYLWFSLHDTTPRVKAQYRAVYCHNSYPFFQWKWRHLFQNYRIVCFALFTKWIYRINIHKNDYIVVQQEWFRKAFMQMFNISHDQIIVAPPHGSEKLRVKSEEFPTSVPVYSGWTEGDPSLPMRFLYPAFPDVHKNMECLCEAARLLEQEVGKGRFEVILTTDAHFNNYSRWLFKHWGDVSSIRFSGFLPKEELNKCYAQAGCLVFPSKVETWGLPISEFATTGRPMLLADLPYAHETAGGSFQTAFFDADDTKALKGMMRKLLDGDTSILNPIEKAPLQAPYAEGWHSLLLKLINHIKL